MKIFLTSGCYVIPNVLARELSLFVSKSLEKASSGLEYLSLELQNNGRKLLKEIKKTS